MMKKKRTKGKLLAALLAMTAMFAVGAFASPVHAEGGPYTIEGSYVPWANIQEGDIPEDMKTGTHFTLYKVGSYDWDEDGNSIFTLNPKLAATGLSIDVNDPNLDRNKYPEGDAGTVEWTQKWLSAANGIYEIIKSDAEVSAEASPVEADSKENGTFSFSVNDTGLYLLVGDTTKVVQDGTAYYWSPQPMLIQVYAGNAEQRENIGLKPVRERINKFVIKKVWDNKDLDEETAALIQPKHVKFIIKYKGEPVTTKDKQIVNGELTLPDEDENWFYSWSISDLKGESGDNWGDPTEWSVTEELSAADKVNYRFSSDGGIDSEVAPQRDYTFTNIYNPDKEKKLTTSETRTGDPTSLIKWFVLMGVALAGIILTIVSWRRDRKDGEEA